MILAREILLAHRGEEVLFVAIPLLIIFALLAVSARRRDDDEEEEQDPKE